MSWAPERSSRSSESYEVCERILDGQEVSPDDLQNLTDEDQLWLWMRRAPDVDEAALRLAGTADRDVIRAVFPYRGLLAGRWGDFLAAHSYTSQMNQKAYRAIVQSARSVSMQYSKPWSETLTEEEELHFWNDTDLLVMDAYRRRVLRHLSPGELTRMLYPFRALLIEEGREDPNEQARYAMRMAAKAAAVAPPPPRVGPLPAAAIPDFLRQDPRAPMLERDSLAREVTELADRQAGSDRTRPAFEESQRPEPSCAHSDWSSICETCSGFLRNIVPILMNGDSKPKQDDVARSLGYTPRHLRRLCEDLGYHSWAVFYSAVRSGKLSQMS
jgi:hypothetical protein